MSKANIDSLTIVVKGGPGSGDFGHAGRPGKVGGSTSDTVILNAVLENSIIAYHVTDKSNLEDILKKGLRKSSETKLQSMVMGEEYEINGVFFANGAQAKSIYSQLTDVGGDPVILAVQIRGGTTIYRDDLMPESSFIVANNIPKVAINVVDYSKVPNDHTNYEEEYFVTEKHIRFKVGTEASGHHGHAGRPGKVGGSVAGEGDLRLPG